MPRRATSYGWDQMDWLWRESTSGWQPRHPVPAAKRTRIHATETVTFFRPLNTGTIKDKNVRVAFYDTFPDGH